MINFLVNICFAVSLVGFILGVVGLFRFPDPYTRMHAICVGDTLCLGSSLIGLLLLSPTWMIRLKLIVMLFLFWLINPTMSHLVAKAGLLHGTEPVQGTRLRKG